MQQMKRFWLVKLAALHAALLVPAVCTAQPIPPGSSCYVSPTTGQTVCYLPATPAPAFNSPSYTAATPVTAYYPAVPAVPVQPAVTYGNAPGPIEGFFRALFQNPRPMPQPVAVAAPVAPVTYTQTFSAPSAAPLAAPSPVVTTGAQAAYPPATVYRVPTIDSFPPTNASIPPTYYQSTAGMGAAPSLTSPPVTVDYRPVYGSVPQNPYGATQTPSTMNTSPRMVIETQSVQPAGPLPVEPPRAHLKYDDRRQELPE